MSRAVRDWPGDEWVWLAGSLLDERAGHRQSKLLTEIRMGEPAQECLQLEGGRRANLLNKQHFCNVNRA